jgi:hypothetical protein
MGPKFMCAWSAKGFVGTYRRKTASSTVAEWFGVCRATLPSVSRPTVRVCWAAGRRDQCTVVSLSVNRSLCARMGVLSVRARSVSGDVPWARTGKAKSMRTRKTWQLAYRTLIALGAVCLCTSRQGQTVVLGLLYHMHSNVWLLVGEASGFPE